MKKNQIVKLVIVTSLVLVSIVGCSTEDKTKASTNKSGESIIIEKVEISSDLLNSTDVNKADDSKSENNFDLSNIESFIQFKLDAENLEYIEYSEANKENFQKILKPIFESNKVFDDEKIYTYDEFIDTYIWKDTNGSGIYLSDINNDKSDDLIVIYKHAGSGNYAGITVVFLKTDNGYEIATIKSDGEFISNDLKLLNFYDKTYVSMTFGLLDEIYIWNENSLIKIADEADFVKNDHTIKDNSIINDAISKEYDVDKKVLDLKANEISYTNSGYTDEEILVAYFKIKKFIELEDKEAMANLVMYPIMYEENEKYIKVYNKEQFIENYDKIINDEVKRVVSESNYKEIFTSWRGAMLGSGEVWFTSYIIGIN
ncbi:MAG: PliI family lysozyme inhibitor of I-type lysozyme [Acidaminobacteraceae bacterium]